MKRYNNIAFQMVIFFPICSIVYLLMMVLACLYYDGQLIDFVVISMGCIVVFFCCWFPLIYMKDICIITYYDEDKIYQRSLWKKKTLLYNSIKEIYIAGSYIYLSSKSYNLHYNGEEKRLEKKLQKCLKNEIIIMINKDAKFLKYISLEGKNVHIYKTRLSHMLNKYFN